MRLNYNNLFTELFCVFDGIFGAAFSVLGYKSHKDVADLGNEFIAGIISFYEFPKFRATCQIRRAYNLLKPSKISSIYSPGIDPFAPTRDNGIIGLKLIDKGNDITTVFSGPGAYNAVFHEYDNSIEYN